MKTYSITQEQMDRLHGAAHGGALLGGSAAYEGCLKVEAILAEVAFKEGFDKSPGTAPEPDFAGYYSRGMKSDGDAELHSQGANNNAQARPDGDMRLAQADDGQSGAAVGCKPATTTNYSPPGSEALRLAAERYLLAVKRLGEESGYNRLTFFEAPISKMPNDELGQEAAARWRELNDAGKALRAALSREEGSAA